MADAIQVNAWDRRGDETDKAFAAFQFYLSMPIIHQDRKERRSLANLKVKMGHKSETTIQGWARANQWVERARAYDAFMGNRAEITRLGTMDDMVAYTIQSTGQQIVVFNEIIDFELARIRNEVANGESIKASELKNIMDAMKTKDDLMRRIARMPTDYTSARPDEDETNEEDVIYVVGGR